MQLAMAGAALRPSGRYSPTPANGIDSRPLTSVGNHPSGGVLNQLHGSLTIRHSSIQIHHSKLTCLVVVPVRSSTPPATASSTVLNACLTTGGSTIFEPDRHRPEPPPLGVARGANDADRSFGLGLGGGHLGVDHRNLPRVDAADAVKAEAPFALGHSPPDAASSEISEKTEAMGWTPAARAA